MLKKIFDIVVEETGIPRDELFVYRKNGENHYAKVLFTYLHKYFFNSTTEEIAEIMGKERSAVSIYVRDQREYGTRLEEIRNKIDPIYKKRTKMALEICKTFTSNINLKETELGNYPARIAETSVKIADELLKALR